MPVEIVNRTIEMVEKKRFRRYPTEKASQKSEGIARTNSTIYFMPSGHEAWAIDPSTYC